MPFRLVERTEVHRGAEGLGSVGQVEQPIAQTGSCTRLQCRRQVHRAISLAATCLLVGEFDQRRSNSIGQVVETSRARQDSAHGVPASLGVLGRGRLIVLIPRLAEERQPGGQRGELVAPLSDLSHERLRPVLEIPRRPRPGRRLAR